MHPMEQRFPDSSTRDNRDLYQPLMERSASDALWSLADAGEFECEGARYAIKRIRYSGPRQESVPRRRVGIFAGLHGDEPAGWEGSLHFLDRIIAMPDLARGYELWFYPVCNPTGFDDNTRCTRAGRDLNREFWRNSMQPEVKILERELSERCFDGIIALHADDTCDGLYGYALGRFFNENLLRPALEAAQCHLACDRRELIDGFPARNSVIDSCFDGVLAPPPSQRPRPFEIIFETPARAPIQQQVAAAATGLQAVLDEYRRFLAYGGDL